MTLLGKRQGGGRCGTVTRRRASHSEPASTPANAAATPVTPAVAAVAVVTCHQRLIMGTKLARRIDAELLQVDDGRGPTRNHLAAWRWLTNLTAADWAVILEDDAQPVPGFRAQLGQALAVAPTDVVSLYLGRGRPETPQPAIANGIARATAADAHWLTGRKVWHAVGLAIRTPLVPAMIDAVEQTPYLPMDNAVSRWAAAAGQRVAYTWPSLVNHADVARVVPGPAPTAPRRAWRTGRREQWQSTNVDLEV